MMLGRWTAAWLTVLVLATGHAQARDDQAGQAQLLLKLLGHYAGAIDGSYGNNTAKAFDAFYAGRGGIFDGELSANEFDDLYLALREVPFNGATDIPWLDPKVGKTSYAKSSYDFVPPVDLSQNWPELASIPADPWTAKLKNLRYPGLCKYAALEGFPASGKLTTYSSFRAFEAANRQPHPDNRWLDDIMFASQRAAMDIGSVEATEDFARALVGYAEAGTALDVANLVDTAGKVMVQPDFGTGVMAATALTANYLIARPRLVLTDVERSEVEGWLNRLYEVFPDSFFALNGTGSARDPRVVSLVARAMLVNAVLNDDVTQFNQAARLLAARMSFVRDDGSDRFGTSRGLRALYYQGVAFMEAMENIALFNAYLPEANERLWPTVHRMADFLTRAWFDNSLVYPYARENESVPPGSNYKVQEKQDPSEGLDAYLPSAGDQPFFAELIKMRAEYDFERMFGQTFNETCLGWTLPNVRPSTVGPFALKSAVAADQSSDESGTYFTVALVGARVDAKRARIPAINIITDWRADRPGVLSGFRLGFNKWELKDDETKAADFTVCEDVAYNGEDRFNLQVGFEENVNACVLDKLGPTDRRALETLQYSFDDVIAALEPGEEADTLRNIYVMVP